jgi:cysteinyl-tRNA synthetase
MPYLHVLSSFRDGIRKIAIVKGGDAMKDILTTCDKLRDSDLIPLGVALDDQEGMVRLVTGVLIAQGDSLPDARFIDGQALVKLVSPSELMKAREEKQAQAEAKAAKKAAAVEADRQKRLQKLEKERVTPADMFKPPHVPEGMYSSWSDAGLPLTDGEGKELSKNQVKKLQKEWANQKKLYQEYLRRVGVLERTLND